MNYEGLINRIKGLYREFDVKKSNKKFYFDILIYVESRPRFDFIVKQLSYIEKSIRVVESNAPKPSSEEEKDSLSFKKLLKSYEAKSDLGKLKYQAKVLNFIISNCKENSLTHT